MSWTSETILKVKSSHVLCLKLSVYPMIIHLCVSKRCNGAGILRRTNQKYCNKTLLSDQVEERVKKCHPFAINTWMRVNIYIKIWLQIKWSRIHLKSSRDMSYHSHWSGKGNPPQYKSNINYSLACERLWDFTATPTGYQRPDLILVIIQRGGQFWRPVDP